MQIIWKPEKTDSAYLIEAEDAHQARLKVIMYYYKHSHIRKPNKKRIAEAMRCSDGEYLNFRESLEAEVFPKENLLSEDEYYKVLGYEE